MRFDGSDARRAARKTRSVVVASADRHVQPGGFTRVRLGINDWTQAGEVPGGMPLAAVDPQNSSIRSSKRRASTAS